MDIVFALSALLCVAEDFIGAEIVVVVAFVIAIVEPAVSKVVYDVNPTGSGGSQARLRILGDSPLLAGGSGGRNPASSFS